MSEKQEPELKIKQEPEPAPAKKPAEKPADAAEETTVIEKVAPAPEKAPEPEKPAAPADAAGHAARLVDALEVARVTLAEVNRVKPKGADTAEARARDEARARYRALKAELNVLRQTAPAEVAAAQEALAKRLEG